MDIHKPKPWHNWREFLKEYGIIVLGVLTALAFEQVVEALHWNHEVEAERAALNNEARLNLDAVAFRVAEEPCIDRRLNEIGDLLRRQSKGETLTTTHPVGRPVLWLESRGAWQIALSGQALSHMPLKEKLAFSDAFDAYESFTQLREHEDEIWRTLGLLDDPSLLNASDWSTLHKTYAEARSISVRMGQSAAYIVSGASLGQKITQPDVGPAQREFERQFCEPLAGEAVSPNAR